MENARYKEVYLVCATFGVRKGRYTFAKSHTRKINQKLRKMRGKENRFEEVDLEQQ